MAALPGAATAAQSLIFQGWRMTTPVNPFLAEWTGTYELPPFADITPEHYLPAFEQAFAQNNADIAAIVTNEAEPSFENVIVALERSGKLLGKVGAVFGNLAAADTSDALKAIEREIMPRYAAHEQAIASNAILFARIEKLYQRRDELGLTPEQKRLLERYHLRGVRAGAKLDEAGRKRMSEIAERLATLGTRFSQNVLADEAGYMLLLESEADLAGLPGFLRNAAAATATERGHPGKYAITLSRSSIEPFLQFSSRRDLREEAFRAWISCGANGGDTDNRAIIAEILKLRAERAQLLGFDSFAAYKLEDTMAGTSGAVRALFEKVWEPARVKAAAERDMLAARARAEGDNADIAPWDWRYYAERVRKAEHDLDEAKVKPYFELDRMIAASFETARRLFGLTFNERTDLPRYHPDVRVWEVFGEDGALIGLFYGDYFTRPSKRGGAWMSAFRMQERMDGSVLPVVVNVLNFVKGAPGDPVLLSLDDARTLFHEFGHGLHGLLSDVTYKSLSGTSVLKDFVELPSQLYEHWLLTPEILNAYALHAETGEPMPPELVERLLAARKFNQGFATVEFLAAGIADMDLHEMTDVAPDFDVDEAERRTLARIGMPSEIVLRHRPAHFLHLFSGGGYAAGYYSYLWSEVMDADAFRAFEDTGDVFNPELAAKLRKYVYSSGGSMEPSEAYIAFRGRAPEADALLAKRGLTG
jgi:peptidyl-dipeptidase Dcp